MKRAALEHLLRAAAAITGESTFYVVGTAAMIASLSTEEGLPDAVLRSREADLIPLSGCARAIDLIDGALGQDSTFDGTFGYHADGVEFATVRYAPRGWRERTIRLENTATSGAVGLCMEPHDLAASKLCAGREKDLEFVAGAIAAGLVDLALLERRLGEVDADERVLTLARARLSRRDC